MLHKKQIALSQMSYHLVLFSMQCHSDRVKSQQPFLLPNSKMESRAMTSPKSPEGLENYNSRWLLLAYVLGRPLQALCCGTRGLHLANLLSRLLDLTLPPISTFEIHTFPETTAPQMPRMSHENYETVS